MAHKRTLTSLQISAQHFFCSNITSSSESTGSKGKNSSNQS